MVAVVILVCAVIPIWYLGRYDVTSLDDFYFGTMTYQAWKSTHSLGAVLHAALEQVKFYYETKQATYSSVFLMAFYPGVWNERMYFFTPFIMSGMIIGSVTALVHVVISDCMGVREGQNYRDTQHALDTELGKSRNGITLKDAKYLTGITNVLLIFLILQTLPVPLEGIFWYNGSLHYFFMESVLIFEAAFILHGMHVGNGLSGNVKEASVSTTASSVSVTAASGSTTTASGSSGEKTSSDGRNTRIICLIGASLLGIIVGGGNLVTGLQACLLMFIHIMVVLAAYISDKKGDGVFRKLGFGGFKKDAVVFFIPEAITIIGYLINITAPGNAQRQESVVMMNPVKAVVSSFYYGLCHAVSWLNVMMIVVLIVIAVILGRLAVQKTGRRFIHPLFMALISICIFAAMFTPTFYAMSEDAPSRVQNIIYIAEVLLLFINLANGAGYFRMKQNPDLTAEHIFDGETGDDKRKTGGSSFFNRLLDLTGESLSSVILTGIMAVAVIFLFTADKNTYTSMSALRSIANGEAARYYEQSMERFELYNDDEIKDVTIKAYTGDARPYLLFKEDVGNAPGEEGYWQNIEISNHYGKDSITVE